MTFLMLPSSFLWMDSDFLKFLKCAAFYCRYEDGQKRWSHGHQWGMHADNDFFNLKIIICMLSKWHIIISKYLLWLQYDRFYNTVHTWC